LASRSRTQKPRNQPTTQPTNQPTGQPLINNRPLPKLKFQHLWLAAELAAAPAAAWQLDPFGHSRESPGLLGEAAGYTSLFFGRADYRDLQRRREARELEAVWRPASDWCGGFECANGTASSAGADTPPLYRGLWTANFYSGSYTPPPGFWWDYTATPDPPIMDDPLLEGYNVGARVDDFVARCREIANATRGGAIMLTMGSDFHYHAAAAWFKNLDKLIKYANADGRVRVVYSTPEQYAAAKAAGARAAGAPWPAWGGDFFPYADAPKAVWAGYFSSRPTQKLLIRRATAALAAARQLEALAPAPPPAAGAPLPPSTEALDAAAALAQHHDAVTGTAKQEVARDYARRLDAGMAEAAALSGGALARLVAGSGAARSGWLRAGEPRGAVRQLAAAGAPDSGLPLLEACPWLNVSVCGASVALSWELSHELSSSDLQESSSNALWVVAYNPLAWRRSAPVRVPVAARAAAAWAVRGTRGEPVPSQLVPVSPATAGLQALLALVNATRSEDAGGAEVVFIARDLPPLGWAVYELRPVRAAGAEAARRHSSFGTELRAATRAPPPAGGLHGGFAAAAPPPPLPPRRRGEPPAISNGALELRFDAATGLLTAAARPGSPPLALSAELLWYNASDGLDAAAGDAAANRGQASGAYILRTNGLYAAAHAGAPVALDLARGPIVQEARQVFSGWATLTTRLYAGLPHAEVEWSVGPLPFEDGLGREAVLRYASGVESGAAFWTDANGRAMARRTRGAAPGPSSGDVGVAAGVPKKKDKKRGGARAEGDPGDVYPATAAAAVRDGAAELAVLLDRAQAAASPAPGALELLLHRRLLADDGRGVEEALNETACGCAACACPGLPARGTHVVLIGGAGMGGGAAARRRAQQLAADPVQLFFGAAPPRGAAASFMVPNLQGNLRLSGSLSGGFELPPNLHLLTLRALTADPLAPPAWAPGAPAPGVPGGTWLLLRLAHLFEEGEDPALSAVATADLGALLAALGCAPAGVEETVLGGALRRADADSRRRRFDAGGASNIGAPAARGPLAPLSWRAGDGALAAALRPMEVRTFIVECAEA
jgi:alpha-mannosidase